MSCFSYSHHLEVVATGSLDHVVRLWTPFSPHQPVACLSSHTTGIVGVAIAESSHHLFSLARDLVSICVYKIFKIWYHHHKSCYSHCVCGTSRSIICCRQCLSSFPSPSDSLTLDPVPSSSSHSLLPHSSSPAMNIWPGSPSMKVRH